MQYFPNITIQWEKVKEKLLKTFRIRGNQLHTNCEQYKTIDDPNINIYLSKLIGHVFCILLEYGTHNINTSRTVQIDQAIVNLFYQYIKRILNFIHGLQYMSMVL